MSNLSEKLGLVLGTTQITLPSGPTVTIRPYVTKDEKFIAALDRETSTASLCALLSNIILEPKGFELERQHDIDSYFILLHTRSLTYGKDAKSKVKCDVCGEVKEEVVDILDIINLKNKSKAGDKFSVVLPQSKLTVHYHIPNMKERIMFENRTKTNSQALPASIETELFEVTLIDKIVKADGTDAKIDVVDLKELFESLLTKADVDAFREDILNNSPLITLDFKTTCINGHEQTNSLLINFDFFFSGMKEIASV